MQQRRRRESFSRSPFPFTHQAMNRNTPAHAPRPTEESQKPSSIGHTMHEARQYARGAVRTVNTTIGSDGGFAVPAEQTVVLTESIIRQSHILSRVRWVTSQRPAVNVVMPDESAGGTFAGLSVEAIPELGEFTHSILKTRESKVALHKDGFAVYASEEVVEDGVDGFALLDQAGAIALRRRMERAIILGTGAGEALGVVNAPSLIVQSIESGQDLTNFAQYISVNTSKMIGQILDLDSAAWYLNPESLTALITATVSGAVKDVLTPPDADAPFGRIATRPVFPNYGAPPVGTVGDFVLASMADYAVFTKGDVRSAMSVHVRFLEGENVYRFSQRWDGQPLLSKAFVPEWSTTKKSHYVALAARS